MVIISAVGADRPGMAHAVAQTLFEIGCNIEDTTMTRLCGEFAMILVVSPASPLDARVLAEALAPLEKTHGLFINCKNVAAQGESEKTAPPRFIVSVYGAEGRGLLAGITRVLAQQNANVTDVQTRVASGGAAYVMLLEIELPETEHLVTVERALQDAAHHLGVQLSLRALEENTL